MAGLNQVVAGSNPCKAFVNELDPNMVYDRTLWRQLIHVADPT